MKSIQLSSAMACLLMATSLSCNQTHRIDGSGVSLADDHHAHDHGDQGHNHDHDHDHSTSDLDRPISDLMKEECEHHIKAFECEECRYEVGVVKAHQSLLEGGLFTTTQPTMQQVALPITLTGEIRFDDQRIGHVNTQAEGIIKKVYVGLGDQVKKGQALLEVESVVVGEEQASFKEADGLLALAKRNYERIAELRKDNISSEREYLEAKRELDAAQIRVKAARERLYRLGSGGAEGGRSVLRAPIDGKVLAMHAVTGELAKTDELLLTVGDDADLWVWADVYERDIGLVKKAQTNQKLDASISVKAYPNEEFPGTLDLISPAMDEVSRTVKVRIRVNNKDGRLLVGMFTRVKLFLPEVDQVLAVPRDAVLEDEGRAFVFLHHQQDYYVRRPVTTGKTWANWVEIQKGVEPSQTLVADGAFLMKSDVLRSKMGAGCAD